MSESIQLKYRPGSIHAIIQPPASKSESNRALIIQALSEGKAQLENLSEARDTQTMIRLLASQDADTWDVLDAGTTMRFLTAFASVKGLNKTLTGTPRMQERPISILVDALQELGANISYLGKNGFPPLKTGSFDKQKTKKLSINSTVSSQYISAILMIAPYLPEGIELTLEGKVGSRPYIQMTLDLMSHFGITYSWIGETIKIAPQAYQENTYSIESDWSGASYWFSLVSLASEAELKLLGLREKSLQGDRKIVEIMSALGVKTSFVHDGLILEKSNSESQIEWDFTDCPDLAQTVAVVCAAKKIKGIFSGLESLRIKETDRIAALQNELHKLGANMVEMQRGLWYLTPSTESLPTSIDVKTYEDHRMAMAFAPLASIMDVRIQEPLVVNKSFPSFWKELEKTGITAE